MTQAKIETRLHVDEPLAAGAALGLDHGRAHFLRTVLRLKRGDRLAVFNGHDGEWLAVIDGLGKGWCSLSVIEQRREAAPEPDLWLLFAPIKRARLDFLIEKATELGCARLQPVVTRRTNVSRVNLDRLSATAREAAEQCERLTLPEVMPPEDLMKLLGRWPSERRILLCVEAGSAQPIAQALRQAAELGPWAIMTGPEGGFDQSELDALSNLPFVTPVGLGPRVLRADTAALAALATWQALLGDAGKRPPGRS